MACGFGPPLDDVSVEQKVVWYENDGQAKRGPWKQHFVAEVKQAFEAIASDLDGDGDIDVVATGWGSPGSIVWAENTGDPRGKWKTHILKSPWGTANQVIAADLNGDGRLDLAACAERGALELRWWRNEGQNRTGAPATEH